MKCCFLFSLLIASISLPAQQVAYDLMNYAEPSGWKKTITTTMVKYEKVDKKTGGWYQVAIYKSTTSKGSAEADFSSEWNDLVVKNLPAVKGPTGDSTINLSNGWKLRAGIGSFNFNNAPAFSLLTTYSGYNVCMSILANTNKQDYLNEVYSFIQKISLNKPANTGTSTNATNTTQVITINGTPVQASTPIADGYKYTTTNFDDGWTSVVQSDRVEVTKADVKIFICHNILPNEGYEPDRMMVYKQVWDKVVVSRYTNITNYEYLSNNYSYIPVYMMAANVIDNSGKHRFIVLFRSGGIKSSWTEFIFPSRQRFTEMFGIDKYDAYTSWDAMAKMVDYNRFAVAASDLPGTWTNSFSGMTQYVNVYTGASAGATSYGSVQEYTFDKAGTYNWKINVAGGMVDNLKFTGAQSSGKFTLPTSWQLHCSDIENKPRDYPVYFSAVKGGRVLWIDGVAFVKKQ